MTFYAPAITLAPPPIVAQERSVSIVCAGPVSFVPAMAGSLDFQGCAVCMPSMSLHMAPDMCSDHPETQCAAANA